MKQLFYLFVFVAFASCQSHSPTRKTRINRLKIPMGGFEFRINQRSEISIPSDSNSVFCYIDDITRGQTRLTLRDDSILLIDQSISDLDCIPFNLSGKKYTLKCKQLVNLLIGNDYGFFIINENGYRNKISDESAKIEALLSKIEHSNVTFIRNGSSYNTKEATEHLRTKWKNSGDQVKTLSDFIEKIASFSSSSGKAYQVQLPDGKRITANEWLKKL